jgi:hypothetical protein
LIRAPEKSDEVALVPTCRRVGERADERRESLRDVVHSDREHGQQAHLLEGEVRVVDQDLCLGFRVGG